MNINSAVAVERVGDEWLALDGRDGVVHSLSGPAATVIDCVMGGQPIPAACDDAVATLVDTGILTPTTRWSRRRILTTAATAAAVGIGTVTLPTAIAAASSGPGPAPAPTTVPPEPPPEPSNLSFSDPGETELTVLWDEGV